MMAQTTVSVALFHVVLSLGELQADMQNKRKGSLTVVDISTLPQHPRYKYYGLI